MSILDAVAKSILQVRVEGVNEAKSQLKSLQGTEKEVADARVKGLEAGNTALAGWVKGLGIAGTAIAAFKVGLDAFEEHAHKLDIIEASAGVSIEKLSKAAHGFKTEMELLEHAAVMNKSAFKLTQDQMNTVETAMRALENRGRNSSEVWAAMEAAITKGATRPLEALIGPIDKAGLAFDENGIKMDTFGEKAAGVKRIFEALGKTAQEVEGEQLNAADKTEQSIVKLHNLFDHAKDKLGEVVANMGPLLDGLATAIERTIKLVNILPGASGSGPSKWFGYLGAGGPTPGLDTDATRNAIEGDVVSKAIAAAITKAIKDEQTYQASRPLYATDPTAYGMSLSPGTVNASLLAQAFDKFDKAVDKFSAKAVGSTPYDVKHMVNMRGYAEPVPGKPGALDLGFANTGAQNLSGLIGQIDEEQQSEIRTRNSRYADWIKSGRASGENDKALAKIFGPVEQFDLYAKGFQMLEGAVSSAMEAWITGSISAGEAIKQFLGGALAGLASQMGIEALKHGAYAIGSLAFGDFAGASTHAAAAAAFTAGAAAAAVAAREFGHGGKDYGKPGTGGGGGNSGGGGKGASGGSGGGSSGNGGRTVIVAYLDPWANQTESERGRSARKMVNKVLGPESGTDS